MIFRSPLNAVVILAAFIALILSSVAWANCSGPTAVAGRIVYAGNLNTMVYCDGTNWISMAGGVSVTVGGTTNNPGGSSSYVQFNNSGSFGGSSGLTWNTGTSTLAATNLTVSTLLNAANISATGNISAVKFIGDGSLLTGLSNAAGDRISTSGVTSGATLGMVVADKGTISFTTGGTAQTAYIDTTGRFVMPGISTTTNQTSVTTLFASGAVSATQVSSTYTSASTVDFAGAIVTSIAGGGGNTIVSSTTNVSTYAAGSITFTTGGTQRAVIDSSGNVGIGTATPSARFHIKDAEVSANGIDDDGDGRNDETTDVLVFNNTGNVGIGTSTPLAPLHISSTSMEAARFSTTGNTYISYYIGGTRKAYTQFDAGYGYIMDSEAASTGIIFRTQNNERMRIDSSGNVGIGTTGLTAKLHTNGTVRFENLPAGNALNTVCMDATFNLSYNNGGCTSSSRRFKHDIRPLDSGIDTVLRLKPVSYVYNASFAPRDQSAHLGFIAEDVAATEPRLATFDPKGAPDGVQYDKVTALLTRAVQELKADNDNLRATVERLDHEFEVYKRAHP